MALPRKAKAFYTRAITAARTTRGAAAVEFALIVPVILAALTGLANYGLAMYNKMELVSAARAGAQQAIIDRTDTAAIKSAVVNSTNVGVTANDVTTTESYLCADGTAVSAETDVCLDNEPLQYFMTVTVNQDFTLLLLGTTVGLSGSVKIRTQ